MQFFKQKELPNHRMTDGWTDRQEFEIALQVFDLIRIECVSINKYKELFSKLNFDPFAALQILLL